MRIPGWDDDSSLADNHATIAYIRHYTRNAARHRFADDVRKTLSVGGQRRDIEGRSQPWDIATLAEHMQSTRETLLPHETVEQRIAGHDSVPNEDEVYGRVRSREHSCGTQERVVVLQWVEPRDQANQWSIDRHPER